MPAVDTLLENGTQVGAPHVVQLGGEGGQPLVAGVLIPDRGGQPGEAVVGPQKSDLLGTAASLD